MNSGLVSQNHVHGRLAGHNVCRMKHEYGNEDWFLAESLIPPPPGTSAAQPHGTPRFGGPAFFPVCLRCFKCPVFCQRLSFCLLVPSFFSADRFPISARFPPVFFVFLFFLCRLRCSSSSDSNRSPNRASSVMTSSPTRRCQS